MSFWGSWDIIWRHRDLPRRLGTRTCTQTTIFDEFVSILWWLLSPREARKSTKAGNLRQPLSHRRTNERSKRENLGSGHRAPRFEKVAFRVHETPLFDSLEA